MQIKAGNLNFTFHRTKFSQQSGEIESDSLMIEQVLCSLCALFFFYTFELLQHIRTHFCSVSLFFFFFFAFCSAVQQLVSFVVQAIEIRGLLFEVIESDCKKERDLERQFARSLAKCIKIICFVNESLKFIQ